MLNKIIQFSLNNKLIIGLFTLTWIGYGIYALTQIPIGAVPDITNNQVQVITTSPDLSTQDVEQFITYPIELELSNLPGVKEIRSVSKFGLSVVTVVFDDDIGTYLPRQLIAEKLKNAEEMIPKKFGTPFMGPITTGLGEIYQYILDVKPGYKDRYSITDLRSIQDWIVRRQLSGIPGVVEVNTWGGYLKQYEVAVNPNRLRSMHVNITEIYDALEKNNAIAGGSYIEKNNESFFIRADGQAKTMEDINNIVVKNVNGVPVLIRDIATVHIGHANRFGAVTGNGEGEKVMGQIMMLKGANSKKVTEAVHQRVAEIQKHLPEGVYINPFLERGELVGKTTFTVAENLILGFIIVLGIVFLLLGNLRSGLIIASVIPLALLFTISMMYLFGIDANLMSLGAIDFGIIIDGAVIIVEFVSLQLLLKWKRVSALPKDERQDVVDQITYKSTKKMMGAAIFGQIIILIVFIPILSLTGVEGKMFRPMALSFSFALLGAMILGLTYVPVVSSVFLKPLKNPNNFSTRLINKLKNWYEPALYKALRYKKAVLSFAVILLLIAIYTFSRMGGEFVPTLDEGDFVIQPVLKTGTSLSKTIETTTKIEKILLDKFPDEVQQVVSRIGAGEVPTDPMSMEDSDIIVKLKNKKYWKKATSKDKLANQFKKALQMIPGIEYEFTQPIEMRFNELITGVRSDLAIKIYGENMNVLNSKAQQVKKMIEKVPGVSDISVEKVEGLPQIKIQYDKNNLAKYGLNVDELNQVVAAAFAGLKSGDIFEGEKKFDLVVRYNQKYRKDINNVKNISVLLSNGNSIPLSEVAHITYDKGPAKISRDDTKRRIVIGVNVRDRDLESVVKDVQKIIDQKLKLPAGYYVTYGGQFENLRAAKKRLSIAIPISLLLIFILLHFAFHSVKEAVMVYTAIPLAAVGGIFLLWLRGMPFSISAGVGFIALFGIAVLNGIVLIEHYKALKKHPFDSLKDLVIKGTTERLRPVLLTAAAAALGFFPMAFSQSAGAEVQRPLATVVIGGLFTSTLLTLFVLPILYIMFDKPLKIKSLKRKSFLWLVLPLMILAGQSLNAQKQPVNLQEAIKISLENNAGILAGNKDVLASKNQIKTAFNLPKTDIYYATDENNTGENGKPLKIVGIQQQFDFPGVYTARKKLFNEKYKSAQLKFNIQQQALKQAVAMTYEDILYVKERLRIYEELKTKYQKFAKAAELKLKTGESTELEKYTADAKYQAILTEIAQMQKSLLSLQQSFNLLLGTKDLHYDVAEQNLKALDFKINPEVVTPYLKLAEQFTKIAKAKQKLERNKLLPDFNFELYQGKTDFNADKSYLGFSVGISIPIFFGAQKAKIKQAGLQYQAAEIRRTYQQQFLSTKQQKLQNDIAKYRERINYYEKTGQKLAEKIYKMAQKSYTAGEINYYQYLQNLQTATDIQLKYLEDLKNYNQKVIEYQYFVNE